MKLEACNPGGSIKEKNAVYLVKEAEEQGLLRCGGTIIASSTGNFGIGLAMVGASRGYRVIIVIDQNTAVPVRRMIQAFGAELVVVPFSEAHRYGSLSRARMARTQQLAAENSNVWCPIHSASLSTPHGHVISTAQEIEVAFQGAPDVIVLEINEPNEIDGIAPFFLSRYPSTRFVGAGVAGAVTSSTFASKFLHSAYSIPEELAISLCHSLSRKEGLLLGGSTGAVVAAAMSFAANESEGQTILLINPDRGDRYLDTIYNLDWLASHGLPLLSDPELELAVHHLAPIFSNHVTKAGFEQ